MIFAMESGFATCVLSQKCTVFLSNQVLFYANNFGESKDIVIKFQMNYVVLWSI